MNFYNTKQLYLTFAAYALAGCAQQLPTESDEAPMAELFVNSAENIVVFENDPALKIKVDESFNYLGRHDIKIRDVASGERLVFADVDDKKASRLFILQFEGFNDGVDGAYNYDLSQSPEIAGYRWRSNAFSFNMAKSIAENPGAETTSTSKFLDDLNIVYPADWMMWRSLTVTTEDRRNELILFYVEDLASTGRTLDSIYDENGNSTDYWRGLMPALERRANASFALSTLDDDVWLPLPRYFEQQ